MARTHGDKFGKGYGDYGKGYRVDKQPESLVARYKDFSGGYFAADSDEDAPVNTTPGGTDVEVTRRDRVIRAPGSIAMEALAGRSPEQVAIHAGLGFRSELILFDLPFIGIKREGATTWVNVGLVPGDPVTNMYFWATFGDDLIFSNGAQHVYKHTYGTDTVEVIDAVPLGYTFAVFAGRLWVGGGIIDGNFEPLGVLWSGVNGYDDQDIDNGAGSELMIQDTGLGDRLVALRPMGFDYMAMLMRRSIWVARRVDDLFRPADFVTRVTGKGCVHERTARTTFGGVIYLSDEGVEIFDGNDSIHMSEQIDSELLPLDYANIHKYSSAFNPQTQRYFLGVPGKGTYVLDVMRKRWYKRTQLIIDVVPFAAQFHSVTWAELVGAWDAQIATWQGFAPREVDVPDMVFLGQKVDTTYHLEKENQASITYFDRAQVPLWICPVTEQERDIGLITTQELRFTYVGAGTLGYQLRNNDGDLAHVDQAVLPVQATPKTKKMTGLYTGKGVGLAIEMGGSLELVRAEVDFRLRGKRIGDGVLDAGGVPVVPLLTGGDIISLRRYDFAAFIGKAQTLITGVPTVQWNPVIKRYSRQGSVSASIITERLQQFFEPRALVDPRYPPCGLVVRLSDILHVDIAGVPPWGPTTYARSSFGFRANPGNMSNLNTNQTPFIGFRLDLLGNTSVVNPTWKTDYVNWDSSVRRSVDTLITSSPPRHLMIELSGVDQKIRWFIDGVLVDTYAPVANDVGGQNVVAPAEWAVDTEVSGSGGAGFPTITLSMHLGTGQLITSFYNDA